MPKYDNSARLAGVSNKDWCEALDELTIYLRWRLRGKTQWGAHSEKVLETPALDYYTEEAAAKLIRGDWKWQDRYTLAQQLIQIAGNLITKQAEKYAREHPWQMAEGRSKMDDVGGYRKTDIFLSLDRMDPEDYPEVPDDDGNEALQETYYRVYALVADDEELTLLVTAIASCGDYEDLPEFMGVTMKKVYRLMEKLMRRIRCQKEVVEEAYQAFGTTREEHQQRMLKFIHEQLEQQKMQ